MTTSSFRGVETLPLRAARSRTGAECQLRVTVRAMLDLTPTAAPAGTASTRPPHAVVIGSGLGGLAAAVRLGARGYRVTVLERLDAPGGRAYVHRINGFSFDAGPTIITVPYLLEELWQLAGRR